MDSYITDMMWDAIDLANENHDEFLLHVEDMTKGELIWFVRGYREASANLRGDPHFSIFLEEAPLLSEDGMEDTCHWIVAKGEELYEDIMEDAEEIRKLEDLYVVPPNYLGEVKDEYFNRYGESILDHGIQ